MTVATELAKTAQRLEYFVCIEGIGWPERDVSDLSTGFNGHVFATNDFDGDLESQLDLGTVPPTLHKGLHLPGSISESLDPRTGEYKPSGLSMEIDDLDDWWLSNFTPRAAGVEAALNSKLEYNGTSIVLDDGTDFATNALAWIGGRELVRLGTKSGGGAPHTYTSSTRGYLGTARGSTLRRPADNIHNVWVADTSVQSIARFWFNRRVALFAHVPGESGANSVLLWYGKLRSITNKHGVGVTYSLECTSDFLDDIGRIWKPKQWVVSGAKNLDVPPETVTMSTEVAGHTITAEMQVAAGRTSRYMALTFSAPVTSAEAVDDNGAYALAAAYQYRTEPGGTDGMVTGWDAGTPQALDDATAGNDIAASFVHVDGEVFQVLKKDNTLSSSQKNVLLAEKFSITSRAQVSPNWLKGRRATFLLDNIHDSHLLNRFQVNGRVTRHPIDVLLCFLTSFDREFFRADVIAGSTTTVAEFTLGTVGAVNLWAGKALFAVEGTNKFEARTITSNTVDDITVSRAFSNAPASGNEYQVRNSIYDVLPIGWGFGIDAGRIDIESFELVREQFLPGETLARFLLGTTTEIDLWKLLKDNIIKPYGLLIRFDRSQGKLACQYLGQALGDGVIEDYTAIAFADMLDAGDIRHTFHHPVSEVKLTTRAKDGETNAQVDQAVQFAALTAQTPTLLEGGQIVDFYIRQTEVEAAFRETEVSKLEFQAMLDSSDTAGPLLVRLHGLAALYSIPPPVVSMPIDLAQYLSVAIGDWVTLTANDPAAFVNSFTGARGWSTVVARVIGLSMDLDRLACNATFELFFQSIAGARIAPACTVTAKGNDANGDYFVVNTSDFVNDNDLKDSFFFRTADLVELRDTTGALKEAETIKGFGTTFTTGVPSGTNGTRIYVEGTIAAAIAAGDYVTLAPWAAGNNARRELYSSYAAAATELLTGNDAARKYA